MSDQEMSVLEDERRKASFNREILTNVLDGSEELTAKRRQIEKFVQNDAELEEPNYQLSTNKSRKAKIRLSEDVQKGIRELQLTNPQEILWLRELASSNENALTLLLNTLAVPFIEAYATEEQKWKWLTKIENFEIVATVARKELRQGATPGDEETTALFDSDTDEFVLHSPTSTATYKWFPGGWSDAVDHAIVHASFGIGDAYHGCHYLMVPLKDSNGEAIKGVSYGTIREQLTLQTGFLRFDHVRVPRENMFMNNTKVERDGTFTLQHRDTNPEGALASFRAVMINAIAARSLAQAVTIAIRYSCDKQIGRHVTYNDQALLDFRFQQYPLLTQLASAFAFTIAGTRLRELSDSKTITMMDGAYCRNELFGLSLGLKGYITDQAMKGVQICQECCGPHGFAYHSGFPKICVNLAPALAYEATRNMLLGVCTRNLWYIIKNTQGFPPTAYLFQKEKSCSLNENVTLDSLVDAYEHRARRLVTSAVGHIMSAGRNLYKVYMESQNANIKAAEVHVQYFILKSFAEKIAEVSDPAVAQVLSQLAQLHALQGITQESGDFLEDGYLSVNQLALCRQKLQSLVADLRPEAVALVEAFEFSDNVLDSSIGSYHGNPYENIEKLCNESECG